MAFSCTFIWTLGSPTDTVRSSGSTALGPLGCAGRNCAAARDSRSCATVSSAPLGAAVGYTQRRPLASHLRHGFSLSHLMCRRAHCSQACDTLFSRGVVLCRPEAGLTLPAGSCKVKWRFRRSLRGAAVSAGNRPYTLTTYMSHFGYAALTLSRSFSRILDTQTVAPNGREPVSHRGPIEGRPPFCAAYPSALRTWVCSLTWRER